MLDDLLQLVVDLVIYQSVGWRRRHWWGWQARLLCWDIVLQYPVAISAVHCWSLPSFVCRSCPACPFIGRGSCPLRASLLLLLLACSLCCVSWLVFGFYRPLARPFAALCHTHLVKQANCSVIAPYWPGTAQLKLGCIYPMKQDNLSHCQKWPLAPQIYASGVLRHITGKCNFSWCVIALQRRWGVLSRAHAWARVIWKTSYCPCSRSTTGHWCRVLEGGDPIRLGADVAAWVVHTMLRSTTNCLRDSGLLPKPFSKFDIAPRQRRFGVRVYLLLPFKADEFQLPGFIIRDVIFLDVTSKGWVAPYMGSPIRHSVDAPLRLVPTPRGSYI